MSWTRIWKKSKRHFGWRHVDRACESLALEYQQEHPSRIIALARGGLVPATIIANKLGVRHVHSLGVSSYDDETNTAQSNDFDVYQRLPSNNNLKHDEIVLLIDDISDRGNTFAFAEQYVKEVVGGKVITMSLVVKPGTKFMPDYYYASYPQDQWIVFPWEK